MTLKMKNRNLRIFSLILLLGFSFMINSCKVNYGFTGTNLPDNIKTFSIQNFTLSIAGGPQNLSLSFNEKLKEYYQRNSNLKFKSVDGDIHLEGTIVTYELTPISATAGDKAASSRLTITVATRFVNKMDEKQNFDRDFSFYQDFSQEKSLTEVEPTLVPKILDQLVLSIFNATAATW